MVCSGVKGCLLGKQQILPKALYLFMVHLIDFTLNVN